jgi:hypothetical protein
LFSCSKLLIVALVAALFWNQSCLSPPMSAQCKSFYSLSASERERVFPTYDLEKQLNLSRCGMERRPPDTSLALLIADRREPAIPILLDKLEKEMDEQMQYVIIDALEVMSVRGYLRGKPDAILRIRQVVVRMKSPVLRELAQQKLDRIEGES